MLLRHKEVKKCANTRIPGANKPKRQTAILGLCDGVFTGQFILGQVLHYSFLRNLKFQARTKRSYQLLH